MRPISPSASALAPDARPGNYWPTLQQELLLRAALLPAPEAAAAWSAVRPTLDLDRIDVGCQRLLPLLYRNLRRHGLDDPWMARFKGLYRYTWTKNQLLFHHGQGVVAALGAAGVQTMLLKGAACVLSAYSGDSGLRPMHDFDVAVPTSQAVRAVEVLREAGWSPVYAITPSFLRVKHAGLFQDRAGRHCDLHWHVFEECCRPGDDDDLWKEAVEIDFLGTRTRTLSRTDQLLHVCAHGAKWTREPGIRWIADAMLILERGGIDWDRLVAQAVKRQFVARMRNALGFLRARLSAAIPTSVLALLAARPVGRRERFENQTLWRQHRLMGQLLLYWCHHSRREARGLAMTAATFPAYLQHAWGLTSLAAVPVAALARARRRVERVLGREG